MNIFPKNPRVIIFSILAGLCLLAAIHVSGATLAAVHAAVVPVFAAYVLIVKPGGIKSVRWYYPVYFAMLAVMVGLYIFALRQTTVGVSVRYSEIFYAGYFLIAVHIVAWLIDKSIDTSLSFVFAANGPPPRKKVRTIPKNILRCILSAAIIGPYLLSVFMVHWVKLGNDIELYKQAGLKCEQVTLYSTDGVKLDGWLLEAPYASDATIIMAPGQDLPKICSIKQAGILQSRGFNVLMLDLRGKGDSDGHIRTFGKDEYKDILGAVNYLKENHPKACTHIFGIGISYGAAAVIKAASYDHRIEGIAIDSTITRIHALPDALARLLAEPVNDYLDRASLVWASAEAGSNLLDNDIYDRIADISPRPVLILHGQNDVLSAPEEALKLYEHAGYPKTMCIIDGAGHAQPMIFGEGECFYNILSVFNTVRFTNFEM